MEDRILAALSSILYLRSSMFVSRFLIQQRSLALDAPAVAAQPTVLADHTMAWDDQRDWVGRAGACNCSRRRGLAERLGDSPVGAGAAVGDGPQRLINSPLERGRLYVERQIEVGLFPVKVAEDRADPFAQPFTLIARDVGGWILARQSGFERRIVIAQADEADAALRRRD